MWLSWFGVMQLNFVLNFRVQWCPLQSQEYRSRMSWWSVFMPAPSWLLTLSICAPPPGLLPPCLVVTASTLREVLLCLESSPMHFV